MVAIMKFNIYSYSQMTCQYAVRFVFLMTIYHRLEQTFVNIFFLRLNEIKTIDLELLQTFGHM